MLIKKTLFLPFFLIIREIGTFFLRPSSEKGYLESWLIGGSYCQNYYACCYNMWMFHKQCVTSVSSFICEREFCWSRNCRDVCEAFAGNPGWKVLVQGAASRQIYAALCLRADGVCWGFGNTVFIGFALFFSLWLTLPVFVHSAPGVCCGWDLALNSHQQFQ